MIFVIRDAKGIYEYLENHNYKISSYSTKVKCNMILYIFYSHTRPHIPSNSVSLGNFISGWWSNTDLAMCDIASTCSILVLSVLRSAKSVNYNW